MDRKKLERMKKSQLIELLQNERREVNRGNVDRIKLEKLFKSQLIELIQIVKKMKEIKTFTTPSKKGHLHLHLQIHQ